MERPEEVEKATIALLSPCKDWIKTITSDNGKEFANHETIAAKLDIEFYFANPYHSWERGANENLRKKSMAYGIYTTLLLKIFFAVINF